VSGAGEPGGGAGAGAAGPVLRGARPEDAAAIRRVHEAAFGRAAEADLVEALADEWEISIVLEVAGEIAGHVLLSRAHVGETPLLALAPLGVHPDHRDGGHGRTLVRAAVATARETDFPAIVVIGNPAYYAKLGFEPARRLGLKCPFRVRRESWRAHRLPAWREDLRGTVRYPDAFRPLA
jgi:putative acetyltransferase